MYHSVDFSTLSFQSGLLLTISALAASRRREAAAAIG